MDILIPRAKRLRAYADLADVRSADQDTRSGIESPIDPVDYWRRKHTWPTEYFESDTISHRLAWRRSTPSLQRKRSGSGSFATIYSSVLPSDQRPRDERSAPYSVELYEIIPVLY